MLNLEVTLTLILLVTELTLDTDVAFIIHITLDTDVAPSLRRPLTVMQPHHSDNLNVASAIEMTLDSDVASSFKQPMTLMWPLSLR